MLKLYDLTVGMPYNTLSNFDFLASEESNLAIFFPEAEIISILCGLFQVVGHYLTMDLRCIDILSLG